MPEKISIMKESGELLNSNIVSIFMIPDTQKKYIITTENAVDPHGLTVLHVSELINNDEDLSKIATDEEWSSIKTIMRAIISGNVGSYQYLPLIEKSRGKGQYSRDISVSASACKQMVDNYADALKSLKEVKNDVPAVEVENSSADGIFPTDNVETNEVNEISPGIADLTKEDSTSVEEVNTPQPVPIAATNDSAALAPSILQGVPDSADVAPVALSVATETPQVVEQEPVSDVPVQTPVVEETASASAPAPVGEETTPAQEPAPVVEETTSVQEPVTEVPVPTTVDQEPTPVVENTASVVQEIPQVEIQSPVEETPVIATSVDTKADDNIVNNQVNIDSDAIDAITNSILNKLKDVQQVEPQVERANVETKINFNSDSSFAPDATLDQVVVGAQNLFMNGVQSLVETITEKVYRDLYKKEKELNEREELLNQREKMLNEQISMMVNNFNNNQPVQSVTVDTINPPVES